MSSIARRSYSNTAVNTTLNGAILSGASALVVNSASGYPAAPFVIVVDIDQAGEELILVGAKAGTAFSSLTRGFDGTSAAGHSDGATVRHVVAATDLDESNAHRWATPAVSADTDASASAIHHTLGAGANQGATGNHTHVPTTLTFSGVGVTKSAVQAINHAAAAVSVTFDTELFDTDAFHDNVTNNNRLTVPAGLGGYYHVKAHLAWDNVAVGTRLGELWKNTNRVQYHYADASTAAGFYSNTLSRILNLAAGDYVEVKAAQISSGSAINLMNGTDGTAFEMYRLGT